MLQLSENIKLSQYDLLRYFERDRKRKIYVYSFLYQVRTVLKPGQYLPIHWNLKVPTRWPVFLMKMTTMAKQKRRGEQSMSPFQNWQRAREGKVRSKGTHAPRQPWCFEIQRAVVGATYRAIPLALSALPAEGCEEGLNSDL